MTAAYFQVLTPYEGNKDGHFKIDASQTEASLYPARAVKLGSDSELELCAAGNAPVGLLYGLHGEGYDNLVNDSKDKREYFKPGTYVTIVNGHFLAHCDAQCFDDTAVPTVGDSIYVAVSGFLSTTSSGTAIGKCLAIDTRFSDDGAMSSVNVARIAFNIPLA